MKSSPEEISPLSPMSSRLASTWTPGYKGLDCRPRLLGALDQADCLVDTGSAVTAVIAGPEDVVDPNLALLAANGSLIECCGYKEVAFKINRKTYKMWVTVAKIQDNIIGWDFIKKFKMNFVWEGETCYFYDKKAKIKKSLDFVSFKHNSRPHLSSIQSMAEEVVDTDDFGMLFSCAPMQQSSEEVADKVEIQPEYKALVDKYPQILKTEFRAKSKGESVIHYIHTKGAPCKAKLRPLMKGSPKEVKGKQNWQELVDLGIVEPVDVSKPTLWSSALHLQPKKCGNFRCCGDFRGLNERTELDNFPLPHLQKFTHQLHGSCFFTKLDICKAYHHLEVAKEHRHKKKIL